MKNQEAICESAGRTAIAAPLALGAEGGPRVAVKDCLDIAGMPTRCGSKAYAEAAPASDHAGVVVRLIGAGCRIVAKTRLHEIAYGMTGVNAFEARPSIRAGQIAFLAVHRPVRPLPWRGARRFRYRHGYRWFGASAAICCGVIGLKPTFGLVDRSGACGGKLAGLHRSAGPQHGLDRSCHGDHCAGLSPERLAQQPRLVSLRVDERADAQMIEAHAQLSMTG